MTLYRYKAVAPDGETLEGKMEAASRDEVIGKLQDAGNLPLEAVEASAGGVAGLGGLFARSEISGAELVQFTQQLGTLMGAGQPLDRALQILIDMPESERAKKLIERIREGVRGGASLSTSLEAQHGVFSRLYINMVRAGEVSGSLNDTLKRLADYLERSRGLRASVINAMIYPAILVVMMSLALILILAFVVPQFLPIFEDAGQELPLLTKIVLFFGTALQDFWWLLIGATTMLVIWVRQQWADSDKRKVLEAKLLTLRLVGPLILKVETARLARTLGTLVLNGVPLLTSMSIARNVLGNTVLADAVDQATKDVKTGSSLAYSLGVSKRFPRMALQMIAVGEESGELDNMLMRMADTFDIEVKNAIERLLAALVPMMTIIMAVMVALIMFAIILPMLELTNVVG